MNRRRFLEGCAGAAIGVALPAVTLPAVTLPGRILGANERIRLGFMGVGGRAGSLLHGFSSLAETDIAALADVDSRRLPGAVRSVESLKSGKAPRVARDFRQIIDDRTIDALVVGTPDHWHAIPTILACQAGKDVYVEKPCSHNIREGTLMVKAARQHDRVVQVGIQSRSSPHHRQAYEYVRSGKLGKVCLVKAWESTRQSNLGRPADQASPPAGVDYDTWLGPAPERPFNPLRFHGNWRWFFDYGTGDLGNDGVHRLDYALRGLNAARAAQGDGPVDFPRAVAASGGKYFFDDAQEWPDTMYVTYDYPGATLVYELRVWTRYPIEGEHEGAAIYGENGYVVVGNGRWRAFDSQGKPTGDGGESINRTHHDPPHKRNFLECIRSRKKPVCDIEIGHVTSTLCHTGNAAWRVGRKLAFDPRAQDFGRDEEANRLVTRTYRKKWSLPG
ncbi:MAG: Gfo/Idh/MocA family oxidoreductase [Planctomycetota bacterium]|nr:Gfo/Idh/MocA family oxidoreductase [Planctomycetota bacterium]